VNERDDVEALLDGIAIAELLVPAIPLILRIAQDGDAIALAPALVLQTSGERLILGRVVDNEHLDVFTAQLGRNAGKNAADGLFRIVRDNEDQNAFVREIE
jgi:hypothetical protein